METKLTLKLVKTAKGSGGDKYLITFIPCIDDGKERYIYVPQVHSRVNNTAHEQLDVTFSTTGDWEFKLFKASQKSGDDTYTCTNKDSEWGKVYLPKKFKEHDSVWLSFKDNTTKPCFEMYWPDRSEMTVLSRPLKTIHLPPMTDEEQVAFANKRLTILRKAVSNTGST